MESDSMRLVLLLTALILFALLTAGRVALTQLPHSIIKRWSSSQSPRERYVARILAHPDAVLDGCRLGGLLCVLALPLLLWALARKILPLLAARLTFIQHSAIDLQPVVMVVCFLLLTLVIHIFCQLLPYQIACHFSERTAQSLAPLCKVVAWLLTPFVLLNRGIMKLFTPMFESAQAQPQEQNREEEIRMMANVGREREMIHNIFEFDDRYVSEVMTHRTDIIGVGKDASLREIISTAMESGYSRIPVYGDDMDDVVGILYVKDLLCLIGEDNTAFQAEKYMRSALFVPENMGCVDLFTQLKQKKIQIAVAVDEYGGTAGIVTMEDLLESIVGNIQDEYDDEEEQIYKLSENCYVIDGTLGLDEVERLFEIDLGEDWEYDTIGGVFTEALERIPKPGEHPTIALSGIQFTVVLVEDRRIARVRAERIQ